MALRPRTGSSSSANAALVPAFRGDDVEDVLAEIAALIGTSTDLSLVGNMQEARGAAALAAGRLGDADGRVPEGRRAQYERQRHGSEDVRVPRGALGRGHRGGVRSNSKPSSRPASAPRPSKRVDRRSVLVWPRPRAGGPRRSPCTAMRSVAGASWDSSSTRRWPASTWSPCSTSTNPRSAPRPTPPERSWNGSGRNPSSRGSRRRCRDRRRSRSRSPLDHGTRRTSDGTGRVASATSPRRAGGERRRPRPGRGRRGTWP